MFKILPFIGLFVCITATKNVFRSDYTYHEEVDGWMKFHNMPANWHEAQLRCHLEGAMLASPTSEAMLLAMGKAMKGKSSSVFTGIHATFSQGDYFTIDGIPLDKIAGTWAPNEPDNEDDNESCIGTYNDGTMFDLNCSSTMTYVCYKKNDKNLSYNECGTTDDEYKFAAETGSCYKFHRNPRTWSRAYMACSAEGAHLAIINSEKEAQVLSRIFSSIPTNTIRIIKNQILAFIGFHDWGEHGSWRTIHGQTLAEAGYARWGTALKEPNNVTEQATNNVGEYCGSIYRNGDLNDLWCDYVISFICEKKPALEKDIITVNSVL